MVVFNDDKLNIEEKTIFVANKKRLTWVTRVDNLSDISEISENENAEDYLPYCYYTFNAPRNAYWMIVSVHTGSDLDQIVGFDAEVRLGPKESIGGISQSIGGDYCRMHYGSKHEIYKHALNNITEEKEMGRVNALNASLGDYVVLCQSKYFERKDWSAVSITFRNALYEETEFEDEEDYGNIVIPNCKLLVLDEELMDNETMRKMRENFRKSKNKPDQGVFNGKLQLGSDVEIACSPFWTVLDLESYRLLKNCCFEKEVVETAEVNESETEMDIDALTFLDGEEDYWLARKEEKEDIARQLSSEEGVDLLAIYEDLSHDINDIIIRYLRTSACENLIRSFV